MRSWQFGALLYLRSFNPSKEYLGAAIVGTRLDRVRSDNGWDLSDIVSKGRRSHLYCETYFPKLPSHQGRGSGVAADERTKAKTLTLWL